MRSCFCATLLALLISSCYCKALTYEWAKQGIFIKAGNQLIYQEGINKEFLKEYADRVLTGFPLQTLSLLAVSGSLSLLEYRMNPYLANTLVMGTLGLNFIYSWINLYDQWRYSKSAGWTYWLPAVLIPYYKSLSSHEGYLETWAISLLLSGARVAVTQAMSDSPACELPPDLQQAGWIINCTQTDTSTKIKIIQIPPELRTCYTPDKQQEAINDLLWSAGRSQIDLIYKNKSWYLESDTDVFLVNFISAPQLLTTNLDVIIAALGETLEITQLEKPDPEYKQGELLTVWQLSHRLPNALAAEASSAVRRMTGHMGLYLAPARYHNSLARNALSEALQANSQLAVITLLESFGIPLDMYDRLKNDFGHYHHGH